MSQGQQRQVGSQQRQVASYYWARLARFAESRPLRWRSFLQLAALPKKIKINHDLLTLPDPTPIQISLHIKWEVSHNDIKISDDI